MNNNNISLASIRHSLSSIQGTISKYLFLLILLFLAAIYGFVLFRINELANAEPSDDATSQAVSKTPHIDEHVVTQLQNLQDNSVSVQTLFDEARSNPFQE